LIEKAPLKKISQQNKPFFHAFFQKNRFQNTKFARKFAEKSLKTSNF